MNNAELQKDIYGEGGSIPDVVSGPRIEQSRRLLIECGAVKILDIGCANGAIIKPLLDGKRELHGVDISPVLIQKANANGIKGVLHNLENAPLPYPDKTFDAVFCGETIEHQVDTDWLLSEINRVLKPGGHLVLTFPNIRTLLSIVMMTFFNLPPMYAARYRGPHVRDFTLKVIRIAFEKNGFVIKRAVGGGFFVPKLGECCGWLSQWFPSWSHTGVVLAEKVNGAVYPPPNMTETLY